MAVVTYYWERLGVADDDRVRLRLGLERDVPEALTLGASVEELTAVDPSEFAGELAEAVGLPAGRLRPDPPMTTESFVVTALVGAVVGALGSMAAVRWRFRFHSDIPRTTAQTGVFLLLTGIASVPPAVMFAASFGYSGDRPVVTTEVGLVLGFCVAGLLAARWTLTRNAGESQMTTDA